MFGVQFNMSAYNLPNYKEKYFEFDKLDKVQGQPNIDSIVQLRRQCKINAQTVPTTLGGGQLGYLALVIPPAEYNAIPGAAPFVRPLDPGIFTPVVTAGVATRAGAGNVLTPTDIATQKIAFDERKRLYNECQAVEAILRTQIMDAIKRDYLHPLRNTTTDRITDPIPAIFDFLQNTYGRVTPVQLKEREREIEDHIYDPALTVDSVFNKIDNFQDICTLTGNTKTDNQLVTYAYLIFQKSGIFMDSLRRWNTKPIADQTFDNFKKFMRTEYLDLQAVGGLTVATSSINMVQELKDHQETLVNQMSESFHNGLMETLQALNIANNENINPNVNGNSQYHQTNNEHFLDTDTRLNMMLQQQATLPQQFNALATQQPQNDALKALLDQMKSMQNQISTLTLSNQAMTSKGRGNSKDINPKTGKQWKRYCWSCGCCVHWGRNCPNKKSGHKDEATFRNRMGGSDANCL